MSLDELPKGVFIIETESAVYLRSDEPYDSSPREWELNLCVPRRTPWVRGGIDGEEDEAIDLFAVFASAYMQHEECAATRASLFCCIVTCVSHAYVVLRRCPGPNILRRRLAGSSTDETKSDGFRHCCVASIQTWMSRSAWLI